MQNSYSSQLNSAEIRKRALQRALTHFFLMLVSLTMITPFVWMVLSSFKSDGEMMAIPMRWLPTVWRTENYVTTFNMAPWGLYLFNTLVCRLLCAAAAAGRLHGCLCLCTASVQAVQPPVVIYLSTCYPIRLPWCLPYHHQKLWLDRQPLVADCAQCLQRIRRLHAASVLPVHPHRARRQPASTAAAT